MKVSKRTMFGILLSMIILQPPLFLAAKYYDSEPSHILKLHAGVPLQDVEGTFKAIAWLNSHMHNSSCVLVHDFFYFSFLRLDKKYTIIYYFRDDVEGALTLALDRHFDPIYLVWWSENIGWYDLTLTIPKYFTPVFVSGRISIFKYDSSLHARMARAEE